IEGEVPHESPAKTEADCGDTVRPDIVCDLEKFNSGAEIGQEFSGREAIERCCCVSRVWKSFRTSDTRKQVNTESHESSSCNTTRDIFNVIVQPTILMNHDNDRAAWGLKFRSCEVTSKRAGFPAVLHPKPLNVCSVFRNARIGGSRGWRCLRHNLGPHRDDSGRHRPGVDRHALQELTAIECSIDIEGNQIFDVFLIVFGRPVSVHDTSYGFLA